MESLARGAVHTRVVLMGMAMAVNIGSINPATLDLALIRRGFVVGQATLAPQQIPFNCRVNSGIAAQSKREFDLLKRDKWNVLLRHYEHSTK